MVRSKDIQISQQLSSALSSAYDIKCYFLQTVWTQIRLLLLEQSDLGPHCLPVCKHRFEKFARIFSRRYKQTTFSDAGFLCISRVRLFHLCWESDLGPHCLPVCKNRFEKFARIFSRRHKQTTFSDAGFLGVLRVKLIHLLRGLFYHNPVDTFILT